jgi:hypothetical protein
VAVTFEDISVNVYRSLFDSLNEWGKNRCVKSFNSARHGFLNNLPGVFLGLPDDLPTRSTVQLARQSDDLFSIPELHGKP